MGGGAEGERAVDAGALASFNRLSGELELDGKTVKAHTAMLEELFLVRRLRPWSRNIGSRHVKTPKLYVTDTGLMSAPIGVDAGRYSAVEHPRARRSGLGCPTGGALERQGPPLSGLAGSLYEQMEATPTLPRPVPLEFARRKRLGTRCAGVHEYAFNGAPRRSEIAGALPPTSGTRPPS